MKLKLDSNKIPAIVISGKMGYGKDYVGNLLLKTFNNLEKISFADSLKEEVEFIIKEVNKNTSRERLASIMMVTIAEIAPIYKAIQNYSNPKDLSIKNKNSTIRFLLQYWGTDVRRKHDVDYWVNKTKLKIRMINQLDKVALITDGRFPNEIQGVSDLKGITIKLDISDKKQKENLLKRDGVLPNKEAFYHSSEISYLDYRNFDLTLNESILAKDELILEEINKIIDSN